MLAFNGIELVGDDRLLSSFNIKDQDLLYLRIKPSAQQQQQQQQQQQHRPQQAVTAPGQCVLVFDLSLTDTLQASGRSRRVPPHSARNARYA